MEITIAFSGTRFGTPTMFPLVEYSIEHAIELVVLRERQKIHPHHAEHRDFSSIGQTLAIQIVHGASPVATCLDWDSERVARQRGYDVKRFAVEPSLDGKWPQAGHRRSVRMIVNAKPNILLAMPLSGPRSKSRGTWHAIEAAVQERVFTLVVPVG